MLASSASPENRTIAKLVRDADHRYVRVSGTVEILEDIESNLPMDRAIREKHGWQVGNDEEFAASLVADNHVLLAVTPRKPPQSGAFWASSPEPVLSVGADQRRR